MGVLIVVTSLKGGAAKTTTAIHLAGALDARRGNRVVLLDGDHSRAATGWAKRGPGLPFDVRPVGSHAGDATHVVVDTGAGELPNDLVELAKAAARVIVPAAPAPLDLITALSTVRLLDKIGDVRVLLSRCPPAPQRDAADARAMLEGAGVRVLRAEVPRRKLYETAALEGQLVRDVRDRDAAALWAAWPLITREVLT